MGRYFVNLSRLDMALVIHALEYVLDNIICDPLDKQCTEIKVLLSILKEQQDGGDPKIELAYKNTSKGCAKAMDLIMRNC